MKILWTKVRTKGGGGAGGSYNLKVRKGGEGAANYFFDLRGGANYFFVWPFCERDNLHGQ